MTAVAEQAARGDADTAVGPGGDALWASACIAAFELDVARVVVDGAAAELVRRAGRLELAGPAQLFEPADVTSRDPDALEQLIDAIAVSGYPLALLRTPSASPTISAVRRRFPLAFVRPAGACPFIELDDAPERALSKRRREDLRRAVRRAERSGGANAVVHEPTTADVDDLLELAYAIEAESWKGRSGTALAHDARRAAFYRRYARTAAAERSLRVAILEVGGEAAAMQIAVEQDDALWLLKIGYSERFAQVSPGQLLMLETLRWAATRGLARYEFLGTGAPWTQAWTRRERACAAVYAYPASGRGVARLAADATTCLGRRLR